MERVSIFSRSTLAMPPRSLHSSPLLRYADDAAKQQPQSSDAEGKTETGELSEAAAQLAALEAAKSAAESSAAEFKDKYLREMADKENFRKRMNREVANAKEFAVQAFAKDLLEVPDILHTALTAVPMEEIGRNEPLKNLHEGLTLTESVLAKVFSRHGLAKITPEVGEKLDPSRHEVVFQLPDPNGTPGTVGNVLKVGYSLHERTIRAAQVGVFKAP